MPTNVVAKAKVDRLLELHSELDRLSSGPGLAAKTAILLGAGIVAIVVALRFLEFGFGFGAGVGELVVSLVSASLVAGGVALNLVRRRALRREIAELEAADPSAELPTETA